MIWQRFAYICRKTYIESQQQESIATRISRIEQEAGSDLYGGAIPPKSWPGKILDHLKNTKNSNDAQSALAIYKDLQFSEIMEPLRFKRRLAYLALVTAFFYLIFTTYKTKVMPTFFALFEEFEIPLPKGLLFIEQYGDLLMLLISVFIILGLLVAFKMRAMLRWASGVEESWVFKYLMPPAIKRAYNNLIELLLYPLTNITNRNESLLTAHLKTVEESDMDVATEIQALMEQEQRLLLSRCEWYVNAITAIIALTVIISLYLFLSSAYSPLFMMGDIV